MPRTRQIAPLCAALALSLAVAACGDDNGGSDEDQITTAIEQSATGTDPSICTEYQTQAFTEQTEFASGEEAVTACEESVDENADSVEVSNIQVDGDTATAEVAVTGGTLDSQTIEVALVKEDDAWKLDQFTGFVDFNPAPVIAAIVDRIRSGQGGAPPGIADCVVQQLQQVSADDLEQLYLSGDPQGFTSLFTPCLFQGQDQGQ